MGELGEDAARLHRQTGAALKRAGVDRLFAIGEMSKNSSEAFGGKAMWFESADSLIDALRTTLTSDVNLLVKGSRFMRMERVVQALHESSVASGDN